MFNKKSLITFVGIFLITLLLCLPASTYAQEDEIPPANDESDTFGGASPDALIILDLSGSMLWNPAGDTKEYGSSLACTPDTTNCADYSVYCSDGYCSSGSISVRPNCNINCSRVAIAKRALFNVLDYDSDGDIDKDDALAMNVRIGYMRFRDGDDKLGDYASGRNKLVTELSKPGKNTGTSYSQTYCGSNQTCSLGSTCNSEVCINYNKAPSGGTPLAASLKEAKKYLDAHKDVDPGKACRKKFIILVTDGADTYACNGTGAECQAHMYERRREVVAAAKALNDHGYRVFVIGFGSTMPEYLQNTLNWMAYYGGTDDSEEDNTGTTTAYSIPKGSDCNGASPSNCCVFDTIAGTCPFPATTASACYPEGVNASCELSSESADVCQGASTASFKADSLDPGYLSLSGYAFIAADADKLTKSLKTALNVISGESYSFTQASIQAVRTSDENFIYEASFETQSCPLWHGHLKRYNINDDGSIVTSTEWDAATVINAQSASDRNIKTLIGGSLVDFNTSNGNITAAHLNAADTTEKDKIMNFIRGGDQYETSPDKYWRLGDIFHSSPMSIGTPNALFYDQWDLATPKAYETYRANHIRTSVAGDGIRVMLVGANDGQLHAFKAGELGSPIYGGKELWSFIPPNQLRRLKLIYHPDSEHPSDKSRQYYVDGPTSAAEIWVKGSTPETDITATTKTVSEWKTLMVTSLGRGGTTTLWSSDTSCFSNISSYFSPYWTATHQNYCGYYAFDVSDTNDDTLNWPFLWRLGATTGMPEAEGKYLGQPWSKMFIGRVRIDNKEKWVGFIGGGYSGCGKATGKTCSLDGGPDVRGKGFYVVDLSNGDILWKYTYANNSNMNYDLVAGPAVVDYDNDGFLDRAYIGDLGGSIWRFQFCKKSDATSCGIANWTGGMLFDDTAASGIRPIYTSAAVSLDKSYNLWVYVGTGDKTQPTRPQASDRFYAIKDRKSNGEAPYDVGDLDQVDEGSAADVYTDGNTASDNGWYMVFGANEKVLADPTIYQGRLYFTTYTPSPQSDTSDPCSAPGTSSFYNMDYITAKGNWGGGTTAKYISTEGTGVASSVVVSVGPDGTANLYYSQSVGQHIQQLSDPNLSNDPRGSLIYWHDRRIQP